MILNILKINLQMIHRIDRYEYDSSISRFMVTEKYEEATEYAVRITKDTKQ